MDIQTFLSNYERGTVQITEDVSYDTRDVIKKSERLRHGKFEQENFSDGTAKLFYNVAFAFSNIIYRSTDIDTKDCNVRSTNGGSIEFVAILRMALKGWMRNNPEFATELNEFRREMIDLGHVVVKVVDDEPKQVNLLNLTVPPHAKSIQDGGCVEATYLTWDEMLLMKDDLAEHWEKIEELKKEMIEQGKIYFTVYEQWCIDEFEVEGGKKQVTKGCHKYLDMTLLDEKSAQKAEPSNWHPHLKIYSFASPHKIQITSKRKVKKLGRDFVRVYPYVERKFISLPGRWLGFGVYELLSGILEDFNEKMNLKRKFDRLQLRGVLLHRQPSDITKARTLTQEFLNHIETGTVIDLESDEGLERLNLGSMTSDVIAMIDKLFEIMRLIIGVTAQGTGENIPSTTPATIGVINQKVAQTTYDVVNEEQALFLNDLFQNFLFMPILEDMDAEDWVELTDDPKVLDDMDDILCRQLVYRDLAQEKERTGIYSVTSFEEVEARIEKLKAELRKKGSVRSGQVRKSLYKNLRARVEFFVINESFDKQTQIANIREMLNDPNYTGSRKALEAELRDLIGLTGSRYEKSDKEVREEMEIAAARERIKAGVKAPMGAGQQFAADNNIVA